MTSEASAKVASDTTIAGANLPVLDLSDLTKGPKARQEFLDNLRQATHEVGFFYLVGHGIPEAQQQQLLEQARTFFALPEVEKLAIENVKSRHYRGYTRIGGERTQGKQDWREQIDIGQERVALADADISHAYEVLLGPNLWPTAQPTLKPVLNEWMQRLADVGLQLMQAWAEALGQDPHVFDHAFEGRDESLAKIVRYPARPSDDVSQGVGIHKDSGILTLLFIEPGARGLQVEHQGQWVDAPPIDGSFVVNIGELLEVATNGYLKATNHRVEAPKEHDRISIPFFFNPALDAQIPVLTLPDALAADARGVTVDDTNPIYATYGENAIKSRFRAHPDVTAIHHAQRASEFLNRTA